MKILVVGGTYDRDGGKESGLIRKLGGALTKFTKDHIAYANGGYIEDLKLLLNDTKSYDAVFWFANVSNDEEKIRDVKEVAPHTLLVNSKRNDFVEEGKQKYDMEELLQRALALKANLCFEFCKLNDGIFRIKVFDPLGCVWYEGTDINDAVVATVKRLHYLKSVTRKPSVTVEDKVDVVFTERDNEFLEFIKSSAETFHKLMCLPAEVKRFVGNASLRFKSATRCMSGFPAIRRDDYILISRRNVDKTGISEKDFVPCYLDEDGRVAFVGENKPSVDAPVQLRLFNALPNIDYILHGHCYIKGAPMTSMAIPCGAVEEVDETLATLTKQYKTLEGTFYVLNLKGHGCLIMANSDKLDAMKDVEFYVRPMPEYMN